jgi:hypothetical protein
VMSLRQPAVGALVQRNCRIGYSGHVTQAGVGGGLVRQLSDRLGRDAADSPSLRLAPLHSLADNIPATAL